MTNKQKLFEDYLEENEDIDDGDGDPLQEDTYWGGWDNCKSEVFNILNSLRSGPNTKVSLNEILTLIKEKL